MAIKLSIETGVTGSGSTKWYALYKQRSTGKMADTTNNTWDAIAAADLADYSSFLSEESTSGVYSASVPAFVETASLTEPIDYVILATAAGTEAWTDGAIGKPRYQGTLTENANVVGVSGDSTAADNAESFFDGTGYAGTNNVIPTVTTATNVTTVNGLAAGVITATSIAGDAITAAKIADGTIDAATFAAGAITSTVLAADCIGASQLAADCIGSSELAGSAVSEISAAIAIPSAATIADSVWDEVASGHLAVGSYGLLLQGLRGALAQAGASTTVTLDASASSTNDIYTNNLIAIVSGTGIGQTRLITAYVGSTKVATVSPAWTTNPASGSGFVLIPIGTIPAVSGAVGSVTGNVGGNVTGSVGSVASGGITSSSFGSGAITSTVLAADCIGASQIATDAIGSAELAASAVTEIAAGITIPSAASIADAVWDEATTGHTTSGTFGEQVKTDIDAILDDTGTAGVIVVTNNDKTGYRLSATGVDDVWDEAQSGHATAGTFGLYLDTTVSSRLATSGYTTPPTVGAIADQVWDEVRSEHSTGGTFGAGMTMANAASGSIGAGSFSTNAIDANALSTDAVSEIAAAISIPSAASVADAVWDEATSGHTTSGTFGEQLKTDVDAILADTNEVQQSLADGGFTDLLIDAIATNVAAILVDTGTTLDALVQAIKAKTDNLPASPAAVGSQMDLVNAPNATAIAAIQSGLSTFDAGSDTVTVGANNDKTGYSLTTAYDVYHADIKLNVDEANTQDEYTITWFKNGVRVTSGITSPTLQVVKRADGTDLIASTTPTQIASTGSYKYDATGSSRMTAGQDALAIVGATIDGSSRTFATIVGRDSSA